MDSRWIILLTVTMVILHQICQTSAQATRPLIGVCYGTVGDNLPAPKDVINLYKQKQIGMVRLFEPNHEILEALRGSGILVSLGIKNQDLATLSSSQEQANVWVQTNVVPYKNDVNIVWISAGNEVIPGDLAQFVPGAMNTIYNALVSNQLDKIKVTTVVPSNVLVNTYPPSAGAFSPQVIDIMTQVSAFLRQHQSPLMINVYPYFAYANNPTQISLDYALFKSTAPVVVDGSLRYNNLFDAMVDAFNAALEKINMADVSVVISETGWPSAGNPYATKENAQTYNTNLINHVRSTGTPRRPDQPYYLFLFAMFNENMKQPADGVEPNFGLFYPNMEPVYPMF